MTSFTQFLKEQNALLSEDLGVFKKVNKELIAPFKQKSYYDHKKKMPLQSGLGQNSKMAMIKGNNAKQLFDKFSDDGFLGFVFSLKGEQIFSAFKFEAEKSWKSSSTKDMFTITATKSAKEMFKQDLDMYGTSQVDAAGIRRIFRNILKVASASDVDLMAFTFDAARLAKQKERGKTREGALAMMKPEDIKKATKNKLALKLQELKKSKNTSRVSMQQVLEKDFANDIPKTFNINGVGYEMQNEYLRMHELIAGKSSWGGSYIIYTVIPSDRKRARQVSDEIEKEIEASGQKIDYKKLADDTLKELGIEAGEVEVYFRLDGNVLRPTKYENKSIGWFF